MENYFLKRILSISKIIFMWGGKDLAFIEWFFSND